jgi:hypothetical protein
LRRAAALLALAAVAAGAAAAVLVLTRGEDGLETAEGAPRRGEAGVSVAFRDVARERGLDFRHGAFRFGVSADAAAMTGGGLCWLDADGDGRLDLYVVNGYAEADRAEWRAAGGLPTSRLYRNEGARFADVTRASGTGLALRGQGCVAADLDRDGDTDLFVTSAEFPALLWNDGDGTFTEGAEAAGVRDFGWHTGAAVGDVNRDGWPDLLVAGYVDQGAPIEGATVGFPGTHRGRRDRLYLSEGRVAGRVRFREVGERAGLEVAGFEYGLGVVLADLDRDGDLDAYLANDTNPNRLYENVAWPGGAAADPAGLGFRFEERAAPAGVADPGSGMGVAAADADGDGRLDLFVTNARRQEHAVYRSRPPDEQEPSFDDVRGALGPSFTGSTGWGVTWADFDLDADLDLALVNGGIPVLDLAEDAQPAQLFLQDGGRYAAKALEGLPPLLARGSAAADYDDDGDLDLAVNSAAGALVLLENRGTTGSWLEVGGLDPGTEVTAVLPDGRELRRVVLAGSSFLSSEDPRVHFGLGDASRVRELVIRRLDGTTERLRDLPVDRRLTLGDAGSTERRTGSTAGDHLIDGCVPAQGGGHSVARVWNEQVLAAIRRDVPAPTVHARNLFHLSAAMWDAWAAYDARADGYVVREKLHADDVEAARETAISYAAYRILLQRYSIAAGLEQTFDGLVGAMKALCYRIDYVETSGDSPAALGNRIAAAVLERGRADGAGEEVRYADPDYRAVNAPLVVEEGGAAMSDPSRWQPLALARLVAQNGVPIPGRVQRFVGSRWGHVDSFALPPGRPGLPADPGRPPRYGEAEFVEQALDVVRRSGELDGSAPATIDIGPAVRGGSTLGTNDGRGHPVNPATGRPYAPNVVRRGDFARALTEFWADGPESETPPGHWNTVANDVSDAPGFRHVLDGRQVDRLEWDVKLYFALNGAVHDAAVAAWGVKRHYDSARPISMIRYLAGRGELPERPGLVERITKASSARGQRHAHLRAHVGELAVRAWRADPRPDRAAGVGWVLATRWLPYQKPTFVTPAFAGYVSGHSTFSRAAAEVLTSITGSPYFPGGLLEWPVRRGGLLNEPGPSEDLVLQWATYYDAADDAGISRLYGGIHIAADDLAGRMLGSRCGKDAWALAQRYFDGTARA